MTGSNFPPLTLPDTKAHYTIPGLIIALITPYVILLITPYVTPIFDIAQFSILAPVAITVVSYIITGHRVYHHHTNNSNTHRSRGACFFGTYGTTILIQLLIQLNIINTTFLNS